MGIIPIISTLLLTVIIEYCLLRLMGEERGKVLYASMAINAATNLPLNIFFATASASTLLIAETIIIFAEAALYYIITGDIKKSLVYSTLCNATSFLTGVLIELMILLTLLN